MLKKVFVIAGALLLAACSNSPRHTDNAYSEKDEAGLTSLIGQIKTNQPYNLNHKALPFGTKALNQVYSQWAGTRYRLGGTSANGIDCSAFMQQTFAAAFGVSLPRSTSEQRSVGKAIRRSELKQGDLVFFRANRHVGVYMGNNQFMHASTRDGVTISSLDDAYWARNYTQSRRVL
ncbi:spr peptidase [Mesocricetibacter intestinalis]|uniref:Spr peptidase n=1 Tax=Mesocricetibacter intestinalis TaxID=1521930 RepID=A0A4R6VAZ2_9PAST|nr:NlpC/P60 family protein [Mesocricetibacter intestinalis]TDQ57164.1 spr peptidase [Mesocricetibacter intestinalis]